MAFCALDALAHPSTPCRRPRSGCSDGNSCDQRHARLPPFSKQISRDSVGVMTTHPIPLVWWAASARQGIQRIATPTLQLQRRVFQPCGRSAEGHTIDSIERLPVRKDGDHGDHYREGSDRQLRSGERSQSATAALQQARPRAMRSAWVIRKPPETADLPALRPGVPFELETCQA